MNDLITVQKIAGWGKLKAMVIDSVSSPITKRVARAEPTASASSVAATVRESRPQLPRASLIKSRPLH